MITTRAASPASSAMPAASETRVSSLACRALDMVGATMLLVLLAPVFAVIGLVIALDSPGPVVFRQRRVGLGGRPFTVNKFRTMSSKASQDKHKDFVLQLIAADGAEESGTMYKLSSDSRVTRVGRLLRKSSLDELPQLWNVVRGDMSLVGPRPAIDYEVEKYPSAWLARFAVRPGMTGLWQVSGRSKLSYEQMVALDIEYARKRSFLLNVRILLRTIPAVLLGRGAA